MKSLDVNYIKSRLLVDCESGTVTWIDPSKYHKRLAGEVAGSPTASHSGKLYWVIRMDRVGYKRSHIVFAVATGEWPTGLIDHVDGDSLNDRIENLRQCTQTQNAWNRKGKPKPSGLPMGVRTNTHGGTYAARISVNGEPIWLGTYSAVEEAERAYLEARLQHFGEYA